MELNSLDQPYANLTPNHVLSTLESVGLYGDGRIIALNSYENRVYLVYLEHSDEENLDSNSSTDSSLKTIIVKFYRPNRWSPEQVLEEHQFTQELAADGIPVVTPLVLRQKIIGAQISCDETSLASTLHFFKGFYFAVYPKRGGRAPEFNDLEVLKRMGRTIGRIHAVGRLKTFKERPSLDPDTFGKAPRNWLLSSDWIPLEVREIWKVSVDEALICVEKAFESCGSLQKIRLHGDCHAGNILWTDEGPHFVDFDDALKGPSIQDIWMLLSGNQEGMEQQLKAILEGYELFCEWNPIEIRLIEPLRTLRLIHYSAWIARRWKDPAFPLIFTWFGDIGYWKERIMEIQEQIQLMKQYKYYAPYSVIASSLSNNNSF